MEIDKRIVKFLKKHHVLTLATFVTGVDPDTGSGCASGARENGGVWCCNLFYAYAEGGNLGRSSSDNCCEGGSNGTDSCGGRLIFTSKPQTRHIIDGLGNGIAASVVLESKIVGNLQGAQIVGHLRNGDDSEKNLYLKRFPYAVLGMERIYTIEIEGVKFTDNKLGFGTKLYYGNCKA